VAFTIVTANYSVNAATDFMVFCNAAGTGAPGVTVTLPSAASNAGRLFAIKRVNANNATQDRCYVTPVGTSGGTTIVTLDPPDPTATNINSTLMLISDGTKWWVFTAGP
jgi:hypothetical protein